MPALYHLQRSGLLPKEFAILGVSRGDLSDDSFRGKLEPALKEHAKDSFDAANWRTLAERMRYLAGDFDDPKTFERLKTALAESDAQHGTAGNYLFYLATPPSVFALVAGHLGKSGLAQAGTGQWRRIVVEKPFGRDLETAKALNGALLKVFEEKQIFRIDHYLGKETVQNLMVFRFGNGLFEPIWNRHHIDHVEITVAEALGVEGRGNYYDATGALRDMVPNHLFQLLTLTAMEPPTCFDSEASRNEKAKVLDAVHRFTPETVRNNVVRAQYAAGAVEGKAFAAYRAEPNVRPDSATETYVAMKLGIDNWRWAGVPFYLRTGKALAVKQTDIVIQFKQAPLTLFHATPVQQLPPNDLTVRIQPEEGVSLRFGAKVPGPSMRIDDVEMRFEYADYFKAQPSTGYETLLYDVMMGDASLFQRADTIEAGWRIIQPVLDAWQEDGNARLSLYAAGSAGPKEAGDLIARDRRAWRAIAKRTAQVET